MNYTGQTSFAEMFEYYCARNVTNEREYNEREMMRWTKQQLATAHREADSSAKDAFRRGWEQCHRECVIIADNGPSPVAATMIAAMEYGGQND